MGELHPSAAAHWLGSPQLAVAWPGSDDVGSADSPALTEQSRTGSHRENSKTLQLELGVTLNCLSWLFFPSLY